MEALEFKISLKSGTSKSALTYVLAYHKCFTRHRFLWSTGIKVARKGFDPARPGHTLKGILKDAETAYNSLKSEGRTINNESLKFRIELIRNRLARIGDELSVWDGKKAEVIQLPDEAMRVVLETAIRQELLKQRPDLNKVVQTIMSEGANELLGFWDEVLTGKVKPRSGKKLKGSTVRAKAQAKRAVLDFQAATGKPVNFDSMNRDFYNRFCTWMAEPKPVKDRGGKIKKDKNGNIIMKGLDPNTIGRNIKELKSILNLARANELFENMAFTYWPVTQETNEVITLNKDELLKLNDLPLTGTNENVRDIFILASFLGPRISDYKSFNEESLSVKEGVSFFEYVQEKTGARVSLPVHPIAKKILDKRQGKFPPMISEQNFRYALKDICKEAEFNDRVIVKIRDGKPYYKKKMEAISPHSSRRIFATNLFYGWFYKPMPASFCMRYTGHESEKSFMLYIGATDEELNAKALEYFDFTPEAKTA